MTNLRWGQGHQKRHESGSESVAREAIIDAAIFCYSRLGLATVCADIAQQAKITRPTVYRYFESAEALRIAMVARIWDDLRPREGSASEWLESLRKASLYRLGDLRLSAELLDDLTTVLLSHAENLKQEGAARLFLSYLAIDELTGSPLPLFQAILSESDYRFENGQVFNPIQK